MNQIQNGQTVIEPTVQEPAGEKPSRAEPDREKQSGKVQTPTLKKNMFAKLLARAATSTRGDGQIIGAEAQATANPVSEPVGADPVGPGNFNTEPPPGPDSGSKTAAARASSPPKFTPYQRGKICTGLALGLSQREAEGWFSTSRPSISRLIELDPKFREELELMKNLAMVHSILRIQQSAVLSWRAAKWLHNYLSNLEGKMPADELLGEFPILTRRIRGAIYGVQTNADESQQKERT